MCILLDTLFRTTYLFFVHFLFKRMRVIERNSHSRHISIPTIFLGREELHTTRVAGKGMRINLLVYANEIGYGCINKYHIILWNNCGIYSKQFMFS